MPGWVIPLLTTVERQNNHCLDMRKPPQWCSAAYSRLMQTSTDIFFALVKFATLCTSVEFLIFNSLIDRFSELRDALEKLQLNDAALKVNCFLLVII
jgi:hypothetical protein